MESRKLKFTADLNNGLFSYSGLRSHISYEIKVIDHGATTLEGVGFRLGIDTDNAKKPGHALVGGRLLDIIPSECFSEHKQLFEPQFINQHWSLYTEDAKSALWIKWNTIARKTSHKLEMLVKFGR